MSSSGRGSSPKGAICVQLRTGEFGVLNQEITVAIPTRNRPATLRSMLQSLREHTASSFEILVVDSSDPPLHSEVSKIADAFGCSHVYEPKIGLSVARNRAIDASVGDVIVFADDDFLFSSDPVEELAVSVRASGVGASTGRVLPFGQSERTKLFESMFSYDRGPSDLQVGPGDMGFLSLVSTLGGLGRTRLGGRTPLPFRLGCGLYCIKKSVFRTIGYFDEKLGRGTPVEGGEDLDMFYRILRRGFKIRHRPNAVAYHRQRLSVSDLYSYAWMAGRGIRAVTRKFWLSDPYMFSIYLGAMTYYVLRSMHIGHRIDLQTSDLFSYEVRGMLGCQPPSRSELGQQLNSIHQSGQASRPCDSNGSWGPKRGCRD